MLPHLAADHIAAYSTSFHMTQGVREAQDVPISIVDFVCLVVLEVVDSRHFSFVFLQMLFSWRMEENSNFFFHSVLLL